MNVAALPLSRFKPSWAAPLFVFVDLQREFIFEGRPLQIRFTDGALANCRRLLDLARGERFPIAHARLTRDAFHHASGGGEWIDDFRPFGSEMVFERSAPSCYSDPAFRRMMDDGGGRGAILAGLAGSTSCLATLIEAHQAGHIVKFAFDASSSHARQAASEILIHEAAVNIAEQFAPLLRTEQVLAQFGGAVSAP